MRRPAHPANASVKSARAEFRFGEGKISGILAVFLGWLGLGGVLALRFPQFFSTPGLRALYPMPAIRFLIDVVIIGALTLGFISIVLSRRRYRGLLGAGLAAASMALGGSSVSIASQIPAAQSIALDVFLLSLFFTALLFVPVERLFALVRQRIFRKGWRTDLAHFGVSHLLVQISVFLTLLPASVFFRWAVSDRFQQAVASQPVWLQFVEIMFLADLFVYVVHRLSHEIPFLWRFHVIHHSSSLLDWLAGSRLHVVDIAVTRAFGFIPVYILGFAPSAITAYLLWATFHATLLHANLRFSFGPLRYLLATPQFHHWHHSRTLYNKNFAVHLPLIDWLFGTCYMPQDKWPQAYGVEGDPVPDGYMAQLMYPVIKG